MILSIGGKFIVENQIKIGNVYKHKIITNPNIYVVTGIHGNGEFISGISFMKSCKTKEWEFCNNDICLLEDLRNPEFYEYLGNIDLYSMWIASCMDYTEMVDD